MKSLSVEINMDKDTFQRGILAILEHFAINPISEDEQSLDLSLGLQAMVSCLRYTTCHVTSSK